MIIAVDFDGTIAESEWPEIGKPLPGAIETMTMLQAKGHKIVIWTCRSNEHLTAAVEWLSNRGFDPDAVNETVKTDYLTLGDTRKIYCDVLIDDKCFLGFGSTYDWGDVWRRYIDDNPAWEGPEQ
jgi:ribonucleotide monophosphatase NagD (HAD superfamily)